MKENILNIINNSDEAVYELDAYLSEKKGIIKEKGWETLKEIALKGTPIERYVSLTVISVNKPIYMKEISLELIKNNNFSEIETFLIPIITICSEVEKEPHIQYMENVLKYATLNKKEYLKEVTLRNIISTIYWERVTKDILHVISESDSLTIVDLVAFFIYKQGMEQFKLLLSFLPKENQTMVLNLNQKISERYRNAYQKLNSE